MSDSPAPPPDSRTLADALRGSGLVEGCDAADLAVLSAKGVSHDHWEIAGSELVLRVPRGHQWGLEAQAALDHQAAAFARAGASGHVPACHGVLAPTPALPRGALLVGRVRGRAPRLPDDMPAIAEALAAIHGVDPEGPPADPAPLVVHDRPVAATLAAIEVQAAHLGDAGLEPASRDALEAELDQARDLAARGEPDIRLCLVGTDTHPGNFLIDAAGKAWFVDLEKAVYGAAPIDLAHASLITSTGWDPDCGGLLSRAELAAFHRHYLSRVGTPRAEALTPWLMPLRRLTWLRTATWFARWRAADLRGESGMQDARMHDHVARHIAARLSPEGIAAARADWLAGHGPVPGT